ncbi:hypothetical protein [Alteromonas sp. a30]|uniref:hypothetical protein n=1 Tax=Alteromonas sp. a30 TaxID=2730917 RepID=UPI0022814ABC|nr:hypothetical protein [Alteromonas sp. a30]MCY7294335.1 hypothetical protein [Alteromonas sp. a30]
MIDEKLLFICAQLAKQGKKPSVGLLKGKAPANYPLPQIIAAVQYWKANPTLKGVEVSEEAGNEALSAQGPSPATLEARVEYLETKVALLEAKLNKLLHPQG